MIKAYHCTTKEAFEQIKLDSYLKPLRRLRELGEAGYGFKPDWVSGDTEYIFFSVSDFYMSLGEGGKDGTYGFIFDARQLIEEFHGIAGKDLVHAYDALLHKTAKEIDLTLKAKPVDEAGVKEFCERMMITDEKIIEAIRKDEASHYNDIIDGMLNRDETVQGVTAALRLYEKRVKVLRACNRFAGDEALALIRNPDSLIEILVKEHVPINIAIGEIIEGKHTK